MANSPSMRAKPFSSPEKGCYVLLLLVPAQTKFRAGALGVICLPGGAYAYAGSAMKGLDARVGRYLRPERARRWHIDYLLDCALLLEIVAAPCERSIECDVSRRLMEQWPVVPRFGSSDCRCPGHLFGPAPLKKLRSSVYLAFSHCGVDPCLWKKVHKTRHPRVRRALP
jgi:Uri superfamily endonuclease